MAVSPTPLRARDDPPRHPIARRLVALFVFLVVLATLAVIAIEVVLRTDYPRSTVIALLEQETGLEVEAASLSTGWAGHTVLRDVVFRLPLDHSPLATADTVTADHSDLVRLLVGAFSLRALRVDDAVINVSQDAGGRWTVLRALDAIRRASATSGQKDRSAVRLPRITLRKTTLRLSRPARHVVELPVEFDGAPNAALTWTFTATIGRSRVDGRLSPAGWAHEIDATLTDLGPVLGLWLDQPPNPADAAVHWAGEPGDAGVSGRLVIDGLHVGPHAVRGDARISVDGANVTVSPGIMEVASPSLAAGPLRLSRGTVTADAQSITATHLRAELPGLVAQIAGAYDVDADAADASFAWSGALGGQALRHHGSGTLSAKVPQIGRRSIDLRLDTDADAGAQHYHAVVQASAAGITWNALDGHLSLPTVLITGAGDPINLSGFALEFTDRWPVVSLTDLSVPGAEVTRSNAVVNLATRQWQTELDASGVTIQQLEHQPVTIGLRSRGDFEHAEVSRFQLSTPQVALTAAGSYVLDRPEPLQAHAELTAHLRAPPPQESEAAFENPARAEAGAAVQVQPAGVITAEMDVGGTVSPTALTALGHVHGENIRLGQETLPPVDIQARASADPSGARVTTDAFPLMGGQWTLAAWYHQATHEAEAHLDALHVSLDQIVHTVQPRIIVGGDLGAHLDVRLPELDYRRLQMDGAWEVGRLTTAGRTFDRGTGAISYQNGRFELSNINIAQAGATINGQVAFEGADPRHLSVDVASHRWPVRIEGTGFLALVDSHAKLDVDTVELGATGTVSVTADSSLQDKPLGTITALTRLDGRTIDIDQLAAEILGGTVTGHAHIPLKDWVHSTADLKIMGVDLQNLGELAKAAGDLRGDISGLITIAPTNDPQAFEPLRAEAALTIKNGAQRGMEFGNMSLVGYAGPDRLMLDRSTVQVADGVVTFWSRLTWHDGEPFIHTTLETQSLSLDELIRAADPTIAETPGLVSGRAAFGGYLYQPHRSYGEAEFELKDADLGRVPVVSQLYGLLNLNFGTVQPQGRGLVRLRLEGDTLQLERLHYYNRGADVVGNGTVENIWRGKDSPVSGVAAAALRPLKGSKLPFGRDLDRLLRAVFVDAASVSVSGTLDHRDIKVVPFAAVSGAINRLFGTSGAE